MQIWTAIVVAILIGIPMGLVSRKWGWGAGFLTWLALSALALALHFMTGVI